jgi:23S rRNA (adenine2503-C2)-methyltransferase
MLTEKLSKHFANGSVYALALSDGLCIETTDTFLPSYTKFCTNGNNFLQDENLGSRDERWMIGVSVCVGCKISCRFCATGKMKKFRNLTADEIVAQVEFIINKNPQYNFNNSKFPKINYTRCGEPFINIDAVKKAIEILSARYPNAEHYISTVGIKGSDFSWIKGNITLQLSLHSLDEVRRNYLIPFKNKMTIAELGQVRTQSNLKTTINLTLVDEKDFDINELKKYFDPAFFFIKISPINKNEVSIANGLGDGIIKAHNLK